MAAASSDQLSGAATLRESLILASNAPHKAGAAALCGSLVALAEIGVLPKVGVLLGSSWAVQVFSLLNQLLGLKAQRALEQDTDPTNLLKHLRINIPGGLRTQLARDVCVWVVPRVAAVCQTNHEFQAMRSFVLNLMRPCSGATGLRASYADVLAHTHARELFALSPEARNETALTDPDPHRFSELLFDADVAGVVNVIAAADADTDESLLFHNHAERLNDSSYAGFASNIGARSVRADPSLHAEILSAGTLPAGRFGDTEVKTSTRTKYITNRLGADPLLVHAAQTWFTKLRMDSHGDGNKRLVLVDFLHGADCVVKGLSAETRLNMAQDHLSRCHSDDRGTVAFYQGRSVRICGSDYSDAILVAELERFKCQGLECDALEQPDDFSTWFLLGYNRIIEEMGRRA